MTAMLDSDTCVFIMRGQIEDYTAKLMRYPEGQIYISSITEAELCFGSEKSLKEGADERLELLLADFPTLDFDSAAAVSYGKVRLELERKGLKIGPNDTLIAAHALSVGATLITNNAREFSRIKDLKIDNWKN